MTLKKYDTTLRGHRLYDQKSALVPARSSSSKQKRQWLKQVGEPFGPDQKPTILGSPF